MRKLVAAAVIVAALSAVVLAALPVGAHSVAYNCPGSGVACGYAGLEFTGTTLFNKSTTPPGQKWEFTDDLLSSVNNDTTGARLCLMEADIIDYPWIGVPAGVGWHDLREQGVNNITDYVLVNLNTDPCD
jgi:hypothetical protein